MTADAFTHEVLGDPGLREFQQWVPELKNGDPHFFVARLAADETGMAPEQILLRALEDRRIDRAIVHQETELGWLNHDAREWEERCKRKPDATFVSPRCRPRLTPAPASRFRTFLEWMLVPGPFCERGPLRAELAQTLVTDFRRALLGEEVQDANGWSFWQVAPDILNAADEIETKDGSPAYFDSDGGNHAWMGVGPDRWFLLLLSVYPDQPVGEADSTHGAG